MTRIKSVNTMKKSREENPFENNSIKKTPLKIRDNTTTKIFHYNTKPMDFRWEITTA